jgi:signal transduction histidine kinase
VGYRQSNSPLRRGKPLEIALLLLGLFAQVPNRVQHAGEPAATPNMKSLPAHFLRRHEHHTLAVMLVLLHVVLWWDFGSGASRSLMLANIGLFLLWQPLLNQQHRLNWRALTAFAIVSLAFVTALSWLLLGFWLLIMIGLVGGRVNVPRRQRYAYLVALVHLVLEFLIGWLPRMFAIDMPSSDFMNLFRFGLFLPPVILFFIRIEARPHEVPGLPTVDVFYGLIMSMLCLVVALGSLVSTLTSDTPYPVALIQSVMAIAVFMLSIAWMWGPMAGFSGLGQLWERYVQNVGTPFELWLDDLQRAARDSHSPEHFLELALVRLLSLRWVIGLQWQLGDQSGSLGEVTARHPFRTRSGALRITIYSYRRIGTALMLHARLLTQMIGHFYRAKQSERETTRQAHLRAIYETGARMTHDIKNLLQALRAMTTAIEHTGQRDPDAARALVQRQLPLITQRLQLSLDKLQAPAAPTKHDDVVLQPAALWWQAMAARNESQEIEFINEMTIDPMIPVELFDSVTENLIENARYKRQMQPGIRIIVRLSTDDGHICLQISDNGSAIPREVRQALFTGAVKSDSGLGIGLHQAAQLAQEMNYRLHLAERTDRVLFELRSNEPESDLTPLLAIDP